jgi:hypothetical protein
MAQSWYYAEGKRKRGPFSSSQLRQLVASGSVIPQTMVLKNGARRWVRASSIRGLFPPDWPLTSEPIQFSGREASAGDTGLVNEMLARLGAPPLRKWSTTQKVIGIFACIALSGPVISGFILYGIYRLLALWLGHRPNVVYTEGRSGGSGSSGSSGHGASRPQNEGGLSYVPSKYADQDRRPPQLSSYGCVIVRSSADSVTVREKCERCGYLDNSTMTSSAPSPGSRSIGSFTCPRCGERQERRVEAS